jgi:hypothetical protein
VVSDGLRNMTGLDVSLLLLPPPPPPPLLLLWLWCAGCPAAA